MYNQYWNSCFKSSETLAVGMKWHSHTMKIPDWGKEFQTGKMLLKETRVPSFESMYRKYSNGRQKSSIMLSHMGDQQGK